jgi:hypothetical protein
MAPASTMKICFSLVSALLVLPVGAAEPLAFNRDIRPILSKTCFACHGPDAAAVKGELRLDLRERALKGGESGKPAIVPGDPAASEVVRHITSKDPEVVMPPPDAHMKFTARDAELLTRWIKEGAKYEGHWAFQPPVKAPLPQAADASPNPVDSFIASRLAAEKLGFSPEADRRTLIRRVSLDLTGLPPSPGEIKAFLDDPSPQAYETLVDRLLASPRFGENFAASWLDASRYADTNGYSIDGGRHQWIWRDWVIRRSTTTSHTTLPHRTTRRRPPAQRHRATDRRHRIQPQPCHHPRGRHHPGGKPRQLRRRPRQNHLRDLPRPHPRLRPVPRPQIRPIQPARLLPVLCLLQHPRRRRPRRRRGVNAAPSINAASVPGHPRRGGNREPRTRSAAPELAAPIPEAQAKWEADQRADLAQRGRISP